MKKLTRKDTEPRFEGKKLVGFTIKREKWGKYKLLRSGDKNEQGCCLGHYAIACGIRRSVIEDYGALSDAVDFEKHRIEWLDGRNGQSDFQSSLIKANDDSSGKYKSPAAKEKRIKELFAKNGIEVTFK